jgi:hypothetical protein
MSLEYIKHIATQGTKEEKVVLFSFSVSDARAKIVKKFKIFARSSYVRYFTHKSAPFHNDTIRNLVDSYCDGITVLEIAFRGAAKTALLKLFIAFVLLCDTSHHKKYIKVLSKDGKNSKQLVTDVYNLIIENREVFGEVFENQDDKKRETTMASFTLTDGRKLASGTVGQTQRGHLQDAFRPDWVVFEDIEDRESISSAVQTQGVIDRMDEAIAGLSLDGNWYANANYISDTGSVEWLKARAMRTHITPIMDDNGVPTWDAITPEKIEALRKESMDFFGEYMCDPKRSVNKFFDVERIERDMLNCRKPDRESAGVKYWGSYLPHHRYGLGSDHSEGIGLDSNTMCLFDFSNGYLLATQASNEISPDLHAHECARVGNEFGGCVWAPEINNKCGGIVITTALGINYPNLYIRIDETKAGNQVTKEYGWQTTKTTKVTAFMDFRRDYNDGLIHIFDKDLLAEMKAYTNNDLTDNHIGLITRHFDLLIGAIIAWQMNRYAKSGKQETPKVSEQLPDSKYDGTLPVTTVPTHAKPTMQPDGSMIFV